MIMPAPIKIAKTECGKVVKVYHSGSDWVVFTTGSVKYKELWFTAHSGRSAKQALQTACEHNSLTISEFIKG